MKKILTGNKTAAIAAGLALKNGGVVPAYIITPQTEIIEEIARMIADGELPKVILKNMDSEFSAMSAAMGAAAVGARVFTATSSQGLELMHELLYIASGQRHPIVMVNVSRGLSAPITLWSDHNDFLSVIQTGWIMMHAQNNQEVLDMILMAFKIAEDLEVLLPPLVNMDGYILSFTDEIVDVPDQEIVDKFLGERKSEHTITPDRPTVVGTPVLSEYTEFKVQQHIAARNAIKVIKKVQDEFLELFGRRYNLLADEFMTKDAEIILVTQGAMSTTTKEVVIEMRDDGIKVGLLRLSLIRPWPEEEIRNALCKAKAVGVVDKNIAPGKGGIMFDEIRGALYPLKDPRPIVSSIIAGLGGNPQTKKKIKAMVEKLAKTIETKEAIVEFNDVEAI